MDVANNRDNLNKLRLLLHRGMRDTNGKRKRKDGTPAQVSTYYPGIYGFSTVQRAKEIKIGVSRELYDRLNNHRLCFPKEMYVNFLVITKMSDDHKDEWQVARAIEKVIHSKVKKVAESYSKEWGVIVSIDSLRDVLTKILNDHKDYWRYLLVFHQRDRDGFWKVVENKELKQADWRPPTYSRRSEVTKLYDLIHAGGHRGGGGSGALSEVLGKQGVQKLRESFNTNPKSRPGFPGEVHAIEMSGEHKGSSYNYAGPGTHFKERQERGDQPINGLDAIAEEHDRVYADPGMTPEEEKEADLTFLRGAIKFVHLPEAKLALASIAGKLGLQSFGKVPWGVFKQEAEQAIQEGKHIGDT